MTNIDSFLIIRSSARAASIKLFHEMRDNALAFLIDSMINNDISLASMISLDEISIDEFCEDFDFDRASWDYAIDIMNKLQNKMK